MWYTKDRCPVREPWDNDEDYEEALDRYEAYCQEQEDWMMDRKALEEIEAEHTNHLFCQLSVGFKSYRSSAFIRAGVMPFPGSKTGRPSLSRTLISRPGWEVRPETVKIRVA